MTSSAAGPDHRAHLNGHRQPSQRPVHHEPTEANHIALERAIGADRVAASTVDGEYLGWRIGITADGDWRFLVSGD